MYKKSFSIKSEFNELRNFGDSESTDEYNLRSTGNGGKTEFFS